MSRLNEYMSVEQMIDALSCSKRGGEPISEAVELWEKILEHRINLFRGVAKNARKMLGLELSAAAQSPENTDRTEPIKKDLLVRADYLKIYGQRVIRFFDYFNRNHQLFEILLSCEPSENDDPNNENLFLPIHIVGLDLTP